MTLTRSLRVLILIFLFLTFNHNLMHKSNDYLFTKGVTRSLSKRNLEEASSGEGTRSSSTSNMEEASSSVGSRSSHKNPISAASSGDPPKKQKTVMLNRNYCILKYYKYKKNI